MGDKVSRREWDNERQKYIKDLANIRNITIDNNDNDNDDVIEAKILRKLSESNNSADDSIESWFKTLEEGKVLVLKEQNKDELIEKKLTNEQKDEIKKYGILDYETRSDEAKELKSSNALPKTGNSNIGGNAFDNAMYLGKNKQSGDNKNTKMWLSHDGYLKLDKDSTWVEEIKDKEGIKEALYGKQEESTDTIQGVASLVEPESKGGRKSRKTRRKKRKPKKSKKSRKSRK